jgi:2-iminobutanoate/2-iminopropanoate deaminase
MAAKKKAPAKKAPAKKALAKKALAKKAPAKKAPAPIGPYTPVVRAGDWIIVSGQLGLKDGVMQKGVSAQTTQAVKNLKERLAEMGANINDVKKTLCFLTDMETFSIFNEAYVAGFGNSRPARSTIGVASLPANGQVEIEAWAYKPLR